MEKNKSVKRMDWRQKVLISILGSFIVILSILFYITYHYTTLQLFHKKNIVQDFLMYNEFDPKHYKGK